MEVHRGEVFYADLSPVVGSEQGGVRPVLIVQNEIGNRHSPTVIAAAITPRLDKTRLPTHINIRAAFCPRKEPLYALRHRLRPVQPFSSGKKPFLCSRGAEKDRITR